jgi:hypothetical protein
MCNGILELICAKYAYIGVVTFEVATLGVGLPVTYRMLSFGSYALKHSGVSSMRRQAS